MTTEQPTITVDRAIGHYLESLEINPQDMRSYYENLSDTEKPSLDDCHIHFSSLAQIDGQRVGKGVSLVNPEDSKRYDPQAPAADIVVFVGSLMATKSVDKLSEIVGHELIHFSQTDRKERLLTLKEQQLHAELSLLKGRLAKILFAGKAALYTGIVELSTDILTQPMSLKEAGLFGLGGAALHSFLRRGDKKERAKKVELELHDIYLSLETEKEARETASELSGHEFATAHVLSETAPVLARRRRKNGFNNRVVDFTHKRLSLHPPSLEFNQHLNK